MNQEATMNGWTLTPEVQAALDAANARLAQLAEQHAPAVQDQTPPKLACELVEWGHIKLKPAGQQLLTPELSVREYFELLVENDCLADARRVLAHSLPKRRALWWGVLTAYDAFRPQTPAMLENVLKAVTQFVTAPTEEHRRACGEVAKRTPPSSIAGCLATAAFFTAGSVAPQGLPPVAPKPFITGRLVGVCVYLASVTRDPARYKQFLREYLRWGRDIATGELRLPEPAAALQAPHLSRLHGYWPQAAAEVCEAHA
jgi:hypothetical protein